MDTAVDKPQMGTFSPTMATPTEWFDPVSVRESINRRLAQAEKYEFPKIENSRSAWYDTIDRLSKKITSQRHEIWDLQSKLKSEVVKNTDMIKIIQTDRKEYREVVSALTAKIETLEQQLADSVVAKPINRPSLGSLPARMHTDHQRPPSRLRSHCIPDETTETFKPTAVNDEVDSRISTMIEGLYAKMNTLTIENAKLKRALNKKEKLSDLANESRDESSLRPDIETKKSDRSADIEPRRTPEKDQAQPEAQAQPSIKSKELEILLASNKELSEKLSIQSNEYAMQKQKYEELHKLVEKISTGQSQMHMNTNIHNANALEQADNKKTSNQEKHSSCLASPLQSKSLSSSASSSSSISRKDETFNTQDSTISQSSSPLIPYHQSSINHSTLKPEVQKAASFTSTPQAKVQPKLRNLNQSNNQGLQRLDGLRNRMKQGNLSQADIDRYEDIYNNIPQALAERPQLLEESKLLVDKLRKNTSMKHSDVLAQINNTLSY